MEPYITTLAGINAPEKGSLKGDPFFLEPYSRLAGIHAPETAALKGTLFYRTLK